MKTPDPTSNGHPSMSPGATVLAKWLAGINKNFPTLARGAEICASVSAQLLLADLANCFSLILVDTPSSGKTILLNLFAFSQLPPDPRVYTTDNFTPASFVTHASNVQKEKLKELDLLPKIKDKLFIVRDLAPLFSLNPDDLRKAIGVLTRVLDGEGYQSESGVHGQRGYRGKYVFVMLGGTTPLSPHIFNLMGNIGGRLFFLFLDQPEATEDDLIDQSRGLACTNKEKISQEATKQMFDELGRLYPHRVTWNRANDPESCLRIIARCAKLLAKLRGVLNNWDEGPSEREEAPEDKDADGSVRAKKAAPHIVPNIEKPYRINTLLCNLARAHALLEHRQQLAMADLTVVLEVTFDSAPPLRAKLFRALVMAEGSLTTSCVEEALHCSKPTALKVMKQLITLGVASESVSMDPLDGKAITIAREFKWFASDECRGLLWEREESGGTNETKPKAQEPMDTAETASTSRSPGGEVAGEASLPSEPVVAIADENSAAASDP